MEIMHDIRRNNGQMKPVPLCTKEQKQGSFTCCNGDCKPIMAETEPFYMGVRCDALRFRGRRYFLYSQRHD